MTNKEKIQWQKEICGIDKYHAQGCTGKGITVLCHEDGEHGKRSMEVLRQVAPDVSVIYANVTEKTKGGKLVQFDWKINGKTYSFDEVMKNFKPDIISCSLRDSTKLTERNDIVKPYIDSGDLIIATCAGNEGEKGGVQTRYDCGLTIGACEFYRGNKNDIRIASYSGRTKDALDIDYVGFMCDWDGTSAATPFVAGQIALFMSRFGKVSQSEFQKLIKPYCTDLGDKNKDWIYGDGLIVLPDKIKKTEEKEMSFKKFDVNGFKKYMEDLKVERKIERIQLHHTYSPSYAQFKGNNHDALQKGMRNYHVNTNGWADIGQHLTIFPDGVIMTGRRFDAMPAGIFGANAGAICIECLGNFDKGGDVMTEAQKTAIVAAVKILLDKFKLKAEDDVVYHAWWTSSGSDLGDYVKGKSAKTCPGTNFFGGNTLTAYENNLMPLIKNYGKEEKAVELKEVTEINDIVWELTNAGIITDGKLWLKKCEEDTNVYWLCRKMANKLRGTLK